MLTEQAATQLCFVQDHNHVCASDHAGRILVHERSDHDLSSLPPADSDALRSSQTPSDMYKLPALRKNRRFLRDHRRVPEPAQAAGRTTGTNALRGHRERCQTYLTANGTARYQYRCLDRSRREIRLLILEPGSGTDMIRCTLEHAFIDTTPQPLYETISYVCGDPSNKLPIILCGHGVQAMATSEAALRRMRLRDQPRTLWIDSICIDQNNTVERGHQVGMMYQIYSMTFRNLIWFGPCDDSISEPIAAIEAIQQEIVIETRNYADFQEVLFDEYSSVRYSNTPLSKTVDHLAFLRLLDNPWFSRLWIVQEVSLAPTSVCHYGDFEVSFTDILRSAVWLRHKWYQMPGTPRSALDRLQLTAGMFDSADKTYGRYHTHVTSSVMFNLLNQFGRLQTFDRRDRVFAMLGLWQMFTETTMLPGVLEPDYNLSVYEVFQIYIRYAIEESNGLKPLEWISEPSREARDSRWPSWLPAIDTRPYDENEPSSMYGELFNVDDRAPMILKNDPKRPNDLIVSGILLDSISEVFAAFMSGMTPNDMLTLMAGLERPRCKSWVDTPVGDLETQISLVLLGEESRTVRASHQEAFQGYRSFKVYLKKHERFPPRPRDLRLSASNEDKLAGAWLEEYISAGLYRAVFHTTTGHIGLGPRCAQPGDVVTILYGCRLPMVMRPLPGLPEGSYRLLGTSYVYGIMDGEAVRRHKEMGLEDDVFRIV
jgi:hypothetical protein